MQYSTLSAFSDPLLGGGISLFLPKKNVIDLFADEGPETEELAINSVQDRLQTVPLTRVLTVKQLQKLRTNRARARQKHFINRQVYLAAPIKDMLN